MVAVGLGLAAGAYARLIAPSRFEITEVTIELPRWPRELDGILIALVADLHIGRVHGRVWTCPALPKAIEAVRLAQPDLLVLGGDFGFWSWDPADLALQAARFEAPQRVAVLGNHDNGRGTRRATALRSALIAHGFQVPENEVVNITLRDRSVAIAGLGDSSSHHADVDRLLAALPDSDDAVILVSHTPDGIERLAADPRAVSRFQLALAGHTHGGQLAIPLLRSLILKRFARTEFDRGLYDVHGLPLFVTKGLGMVGYYARFRARPEVALLRIKARAA